MTARRPSPAERGLPRICFAFVFRIWLLRLN
jgi:hypothetical protein